MVTETSYISVDDQFCGAGGTSIAVEAEGGEVRHAWNHDPIAIESHAANFPHVEHECVDISTIDPRRYAGSTVLVTTPECKNHGPGDGKKKPRRQLSMFDDDLVDPAAERSRMTMAQVPRFAEVLHYKAIIVENVVEVRNWRYWDEWLQALHNLDYNIQEVFWNSAFFAPTPQSRDRIYVVATKKGIPLPDLDYRPPAWCPNCGSNVEAVQVWRNPLRKWGKWRKQYDYHCPNARCGQVVIPYYYCAWNVIDWTIPSPRIGDRDRPLRPNTIRRIEHGLNKFGNQSGLVDLAYTHGEDGSRASSLADFYRTQTTAETRGLYVPPFIIGQQSGSIPRPLTDTLPTIAGAGAISLTTPPFIVPLDHGSSDKAPEPLRRWLSTQTGRQDKALCVPPFIIELRHNGTSRGLDEMLATITAGGNHHGLLTPFLASYYAKDAGHPLTEAMPTQPSKDRHALVTPAGAPEIDDCGFRMLDWTEVRRGMAFPETYIVHGTSRQKVSQLGNAVNPPPVRQLVRSVFDALNPRQV